MRGKKANHEMFKEAFEDYRGMEFTTQAIKGMILKKFPDFNAGSILPNDHAEGNKSPCWCAGTKERIFDRIERGKYKVR